MGAERYLRDGAILPEDEEERIKANDAILLGAVGDPRSRLAFWSAACFEASLRPDHYVNLRPSALQNHLHLPTLATSTSWWCAKALKACTAVRVALFVGTAGGGHRGVINTAYGVERVVRYAFKLARSK